MPVAWRTDYAMRIMYEAARLGSGQQASINVLSERADVPYDFARQIANHLAHEGLLVSRRGSKGGFALARPADKITELEIFVAMGEKPTLSLCSHDETLCSRAGRCPVHHGVWQPIDEMITKHLASMTLAAAVELGLELEEEQASEAS